MDKSASRSVYCCRRERHEGRRGLGGQSHSCFLSNWRDSAGKIPVHMPLLEGVCSQPWQFMTAPLKSWGFSVWENVYLCASAHSWTINLLSALSESANSSRWYMIHKAFAECWCWLCFWPAAEEVRLQCGERNQVCLTPAGCYFRSLSWGKKEGETQCDVNSWCCREGHSFWIHKAQWECVFQAFWGEGELSQQVIGKGRCVHDVLFWNRWVLCIILLFILFINVKFPWLYLHITQVKGLVWMALVLWDMRSCPTALVLSVSLHMGM